MAYLASPGVGVFLCTHFAHAPQARAGECVKAHRADIGDEQRHAGRCQAILWVPSQRAPRAAGAAEASASGLTLPSNPICETATPASGLCQDVGGFRIDTFSRPEHTCWQVQLELVHLVEILRQRRLVRRCAGDCCAAECHWRGCQQLQKTSPIRLLTVASLLCALCGLGRRADRPPRRTWACSCRSDHGWVQGAER